MENCHFARCLSCLSIPRLRPHQLAGLWPAAASLRHAHRLFHCLCDVNRCGSIIDSGRTESIRFSDCFLPLGRSFRPRNRSLYARYRVAAKVQCLSRSTAQNAVHDFKFHRFLTCLVSRQSACCCFCDGFRSSSESCRQVLWLKIRTAKKFRICSRWQIYVSTSLNYIRSVCIRLIRPSLIRTENTLLNGIGHQLGRGRGTRHSRSRNVYNKGKGKGLDTCYSAAYMSETRDQQRFYNIGTGSWLAWANGAAAHYVAIHCPR